MGRERGGGPVAFSPLNGPSIPWRSDERFGRRSAGFPARILLGWSGLERDRIWNCSNLLGLQADRGIQQLGKWSGVPDGNYSLYRTERHRARRVTGAVVTWQPRVVHAVSGQLRGSI